VNRGSPDDFFPTVLAFVLGEEGKLSNQASDPGRLTYAGITQATLDGLHGSIAGLPTSPALLTQAQIQLVYRLAYYNAVGGPSLPRWCALALTDAAVNSGPGTAAQWLQEALRVTPDGDIGVKTLAALGAADARTTLREFHARRAANFMQRPPAEIRVNSEGWGRRLLFCHDTASALIQP
jgi:lysozyme family protein